MPKALLRDVEELSLAKLRDDDDWQFHSNVKGGRQRQRNKERKKERKKEREREKKTCVYIYIHAQPPLRHAKVHILPMYP